MTTTDTDYTALSNPVVNLTIVQKAIFEHLAALRTEGSTDALMITNYNQAEHALYLDRLHVVSQIESAIILLLRIDIADTEIIKQRATEVVRNIRFNFGALTQHRQSANAAHAQCIIEAITIFVENAPQWASQLNEYKQATALITPTIT